MFQLSLAAFAFKSGAAEKLDRRGEKVFFPKARPSHRPSCPNSSAYSAFIARRLRPHNSLPQCFSPHFSISPAVAMAMATTTYFRQEKPKRPLTAYNIFFRDERQRLLETLPVLKNVKSKKAHGKISFPDLAKRISREWKRISPASKVHYCELACHDKLRYYREMEEWRAGESSPMEDQNSVANDYPVITPTPSSAVPDQEPSIHFDESHSSWNHQQDHMHFNFAYEIPETNNFTQRIPTTEELVGRVELAIFPHGRPSSCQIRHFGRCSHDTILTDQASVALLAKELDPECQDILMLVFPSNHY
eukprot:scaffold2179_cov165-Amphora_coffeaeformis.AAC.13